MGNSRNTGFLQNAVKVADNGDISLMHGNTMLMQISASGAITTTGVISGSNALSASYAVNATTSSFAASATSASYAVSATTSSYADAFTVAGTLTAQTLVVQTITSSVDFVTGSTRFGSVIGNTHQFTGSVSISGSLSGTDISLQSSNFDIFKWQKTSGTASNIYSLSADSSGCYIQDITNTKTLLYLAENTGTATFSSDIQGGGDLYFNKATRTTIYPTTTNQNLHIKSNGSGVLQLNNDNTGNLTICVGGGNVGIGTNSPTYKLTVKNSASDNYVVRFTGGASELTNVDLYLANAGASFGTRSNHSFALFTNDTDRLKITSTGNVGIGVSSPSAKLQVDGSRIFQNSVAYGKVETQFAYSAFTNPTVSIFTHNSTAAYAQETIKVTVIQNGVSNGYGNFHVGYAVIGNNPYTPTTWVSTMTVQGGNISNVGTLSWSGNTLQYTTSRATNYDNYAIIVEWAATNSDSSPTYPSL